MKRNNDVLIKYVSGAAFATLIFLFVILSSVGQTVLGAFLPKDAVGYIAVAGLLPEIALIITIRLFRKVEHFGLKNVVSEEKPDPLIILLSVMLAGGMMFGLGFINVLIEKLYVYTGLNVNQGFVVGDVFSLVIYTLVFAVFPSFTEETFFRGLMVKMTDKMKETPRIIAISLAFALYHCSGVQFFYQFIYGLILGFIAVRGKSTVPCIVAHLVNNAVILLFEFLGIKVDFFAPLTIAVGITVLTVSIILLQVRFAATEKKRGKDGHVHGKGSEPVSHFYLPFGIIGMAVCLVLAVLGAI